MIRNFLITILMSLWCVPAFGHELGIQPLQPIDLGALVKELRESGGGWSGNGGGNSTQDNLWYVDRGRPVRYCIERSQDYPLGFPALQVMVRNSLDAWIDLLKKYNLGQVTGVDRFTLQEPLEIAIGFEEETCRDSTDVTFLFGEQNEEVDAYLRLYSEDGLGLALRESYDHDTKWHRGFVWIDNFSSDPFKIKHLLLHEIGHIFGFKHDSVFVMASDIGTRLRSKVFDSSYFDRIESENWPYSFAVGETRLISSNRWVHRDVELFKGCDSNTIPARLLPLSILERLGLTRLDCIKIELKKLSHDQLRFTHSYELLIANPLHSREHRLLGSFTPSQIRSSEPGPGIYSHWSFEGIAVDHPGLPEQTFEPMKVWRYLTFANTPVRKKENGCFQLNETCIPASLSYDRGLVIEIFAGSESWWTIQSAESLILSN